MIFLFFCECMVVVPMDEQKNKKCAGSLPEDTHQKMYKVEVNSFFE